jgi:uncharacterized membrane protein
VNKKRRQDKPRQPPPQLPSGETLRQIVRQEIRQEISVSSTFSGPLPPPDILARYNDAVPDGAERIIALAERQAAHRMALESRVVDADIKRSNLGLGAGLLVALAGLFASFLMVDRGNAVAGAVVASLDLAGLVAVFVYGTVSRRSERQQRAKMLSGES